MTEKFLYALNYINGNTAYGIWQDLNEGNCDDVISIDSMKIFIDFFSFAIEKNIIVEYDIDKKIPVFSEDPPNVVANRIFSDFHEKIPDLPKKCPPDSDDFVGYMFYKQGWAVLYQGTTLILPDV
ncbi:hypothetical protein KBX73_03060 [Acetobacter persici]|uniref:hypothetical protein n=1 Tax=Acetobacter persici TaxID=1076596 RepID=UPI0020CE4353|nr:hypothetical protein [Acetobacter persici]MCP9318771.1 hypothetical protein [Acetobacter persici]